MKFPPVPEYFPSIFILFDTLFLLLNCCSSWHKTFPLNGLQSNLCEGYATETYFYHECTEEIFLNMTTMKGILTSVIAMTGLLRTYLHLEIHSNKNPREFFL